MIDYILDNMIVNKRSQHAKARKFRTNSVLEYTICEEIAYEQRLAPVDERKVIKGESKTLVEVSDFDLLVDIANEMIDHDVLDLDEGGGDVMIAYEARVERQLNLLIESRVVVSDDIGVRSYCERHELQIIDGDDYTSVLQSL